VQRIEAEILIPGKGQPIQDGCVVLEGAQILFAGPLASAPEDQGAQVIRVPAVMPGLWDCHTHFAGALNSDTLKKLTDPTALAAMRVVGDARLALDAGFTSVRATASSSRAPSRRARWSARPSTPPARG
jgi:imidazolonepropionase-like amidohydrolase